VYNQQQQQPYPSTTLTAKPTTSIRVDLWQCHKAYNVNNKAYNVNNVDSKAYNVNNIVVVFLQHFLA
jgi:hypothetical protein